MKLLIVSEMFPPTYNAAGISAARVAKFMIHAGHDVKIVARSSPHPNAALLHDDRELQQRTRFVIPRKHSFSKGRLGMIASAMRTGLWEYSARWVPDGIEGATGVIQDWRPDLIFSRSEPFSSHLVAYRLSRRWAIPWVAAFGDPWPRSLYPPPYELSNNLITTIHLSRWQRRVLRQCNRCIFPTSPIREIMMKSAGPEVAAKAVVIPHIAPEPKRQEDLTQQDKLTVLHAGSIPEERYPTGLAPGVAQLAHRNPAVRRQVRFQFVGRTCERLRKSFLENAIGEMFESRPPVSYGESLHLARNAQILLIIEADMRESIFLPSKFVDYVSTGRPILALSPKNGPVATFLAQGGGGIAPPSDAEAIGAVLDEFYAAWVAGSLEKTFSSQSLYDQFSLETLGPSILDCFKKAIDDRPK
jgi:glycosyltransferase involved in cell wall biosynthesis